MKVGLNSPGKGILDLLMRVDVSESGQFKYLWTG